MSNYINPRRLPPEQKVCLAFQNLYDVMRIETEVPAASHRERVEDVAVTLFPVVSEIIRQSISESGFTDVHDMRDLWDSAGRNLIGFLWNFDPQTGNLEALLRKSLRDSLSLTIAAKRQRKSTLNRVVDYGELIELP